MENERNVSAKKMRISSKENNNPVLIKRVPTSKKERSLKWK